MESIVGVDLSGPANVKDTAVVWLVGTDGRLRYEGHQLGVDDAGLRSLVADLAARSSVAVGLDAPLSYNPGHALVASGGFNISIRAQLPSSSYSRSEGITP